MLFCRNFATEIKSYETQMDRMTPADNPSLRHQAAKSYTEEQARLLLAMRDMVKWEVKRQLNEILNHH